MTPLFTTLAKTITGKIAIGLAAATMGVGAAAAAGAEMPTSTDAEQSGDETGEQSGEETGEQSGDETREETGEETREETGEETREQPAAEPGGAESTHGDVVSTFTRETELVGCEKGQATAAVARGDVEPSSATLTEDLEPYLTKCVEAAQTDEPGDEPIGDVVDADPVEVSDAATGWKDVRDENRATWHDAKDTFEAACGGDDDGDDDGDDSESSPECEAMKSELKQLHTDGRTEWHDARDAAHDERKAERAEDTAERAQTKAERTERKPDRATGKGQSGKGEGGKGKSGKD